MSTEEMSFSPTLPVEHAEFDVEGVLFDMDGTLVDSIKAAWGAVAAELGEDPEKVIAATHGRRAIDNLRDLKPQLRRLTNEQMEPHVEEFEKKILQQADEFKEKARSRRASESSSRRNSTSSSRRPSRRGSSSSGQNPLLSGLAGGQFGMSSIKREEPKSDMDQVSDRLANLDTSAPDRMSQLDQDPFADSDDEDNSDFDLNEYTEEEIGCSNKSVRILPGVRRFIDSLPGGRYAVATSGAKTYCHGALARAGIKRPKVTVTADDPRLTAGKPDPAPFILAAKDLGIPIEKCLVLEDSPSGIMAGVRSGARTIAVCTSHPVEKINSQGAHYVVPSLDCVHARRNPDGKTIRIIIDAHPTDHPRHGSRGSFTTVPPNWREIQAEHKAQKLAAINGAAKDKSNFAMLGVQKKDKAAADEAKAAADEASA
ncbi:hypothetical protein Rhopal_000816-T1 [Rhodotorula paludigena]|uniref:Uncharacterized protein n=1 Tax=Rhodotorula paludigena TaxID=86838 RepID=A0AAV5G5N6_9BASI|nr:hypothetical protein Rhopal_000816-T1 [Rhodotorula paludigena]